jgi:hypothetical protein
MRYFQLSGFNVKHVCLGWLFVVLVNAKEQPAPVHRGGKALGLDVNWSLGQRMGHDKCATDSQ